MSDGIIQEVIGEQIKTHKQFAIDNTDVMFSRINQEIILMLERLQQELIEKIKQICDKQYDEIEEYPDMISRFDLIGDSK